MKKRLCEVLFLYVFCGIVILSELLPQNNRYYNNLQDAASFSFDEAYVYATFQDKKPQKLGMLFQLQENGNSKFLQGGAQFKHYVSSLNLFSRTLFRQNAVGLSLLILVELVHPIYIFIEHKMLGRHG